MSCNIERNIKGLAQLLDSIKTKLGLTGKDGTEIALDVLKTAAPGMVTDSFIRSLKEGKQTAEAIVAAQLSANIATISEFKKTQHDGYYTIIKKQGVYAMRSPFSATASLGNPFIMNNDVAPNNEAEGAIDTVVNKDGATVSAMFRMWLLSDKKGSFAPFAESLRGTDAVKDGRKKYILEQLAQHNADTRYNYYKPGSQDITHIDVLHEVASKGKEQSPLVQKGTKKLRTTTNGTTSQPKAAKPSDGRIGFTLHGNVAHGKPGGKDYTKATNANVYIGHPTTTRKSSTGTYLQDATNQGIPTNEGIKPTSKTVAFASVNGNGSLTQEAGNATVRDIAAVLEAGGTVLMDNDEFATRNWNTSGEGEIQKALIYMKYTKTEITITDNGKEFQVNEFSKKKQEAAPAADTIDDYAETLETPVSPSKDNDATIASQDGQAQKDTQKKPMNPKDNC